MRRLRRFSLAPGRLHLKNLLPRLTALTEWTAAGAEAVVRAYAEEEGAKLGTVAQPLRAALTGRSTSPGIFDVLAVLGREESLGRIADQAGLRRLNAQRRLRAQRLPVKKPRYDPLFSDATGKRFSDSRAKEGSLVMLRRAKPL